MTVVAGKRSRRSRASVRHAPSSPQKGRPGMKRRGQSHGKSGRLTLTAMALFRRSLALRTRPRPLVRIDPRQGGGTAPHDRMRKCVTDVIDPQLRRTRSRGTATLHPRPPISSNMLTETAGGAGLSACSSDPVPAARAHMDRGPPSRGHPRSTHTCAMIFHLGCGSGPKVALSPVKGCRGRPMDL